MLLMLGIHLRLYHFYSLSKVFHRLGRQALLKQKLVISYQQISKNTMEGLKTSKIFISISGGKIIDIRWLKIFKIIYYYSASPILSLYLSCYILKRIKKENILWIECISAKIQQEIINHNRPHYVIVQELPGV